MVLRTGRYIPAQLAELAGTVDGEVQRGPDILIHADGLVGAPDEAAAEEGGEQDDAIIPLVFRAGQVQLVKEPVDVEKRGRELVENKCWAVKVKKGPLEDTTRTMLAVFSLGYREETLWGGKLGTYKSKGKHTQRTHSMRPHADAEDANIRTRHHQIPQKVPRGKPLNHSTPARIPIHPLQRAHIHSFLVHIHHPQRRRIDAAGLHQRDDMDVPVDLRASVEGRVDPGEEIRGCERGEDGLHELVEEKGGDDFVDVRGQGREAEGVG